MRWRVQVTVFALLVTLLAPGGASAAPADRFDMFRLTAPAARIGELVRAGYDIAATRPAPGPALEADLVLSPAEATTLRATGLRLRPWRNTEGRSVQDLARVQARDGFSVWRSWDEEGGIADELADLAREHPDLVEHRVVGHSVEGRDIVALRVTAGAASVPAGTRPAVLHLSAQHAREWISVEVNRRLLRAYVDGYGTDPEITGLLGSTELWFVLVANPDGYQRTFESDRLWRKNNRDNDGNGRLNAVDGVDLNRNFPDHFAYDTEGASPRPENATYHGPSAGSEPETQAVMDLMAQIHFAFAVNYHSYGKLLLYPFGWQDDTPSADDPIYETLAGTTTNPAIPGYHPMLSTELYVTNGETMSWAHATHGTLAFTPELGEGIPGNGFLFPDNEAVIRQEYELNRPFALDVARSAADPAHPVSHLGNHAPPLTVDSFAVSHGDPQTIQARAARGLGAVTLRSRVNGGPVRAAPTAEWDGGARYGGPGDVHYRLVRGQVSGTAPGDSVEAWFEGGGVKSEAFTYRVAVGSPHRVLVVAGGDLAPRAALPAALPARPDLGLVPEPGRAPTGARAVMEALAAAGISADTYDVEAHGRRSPHPLGVLAHYEAVVWVTPAPSGESLPGVTSRLAQEESMAARDYLNEGGRLLYLGREAGRPYADGDEYDSTGDRPCNPFDRGEDGCTTLSDDFFQYWLGAYEREHAGGGREVDGVDVPFAGATFDLGGQAGPGAAAAFRPTTEALDPSDYPHLDGRASARYRRPSSPAGTDAAGVTTGPAVLLGFSLEDLTGVEARTDVVRRALGYLLG